MTEARFVHVAADSAAYTISTFFLNLRLASRITTTVIAVGIGRLAPAVAVAALVACCLYDLGLYLLARRRTPVPPAVRLVLDAADVALWSAVLGRLVDTPSMLAAPLALEVGLRRGWLALAVPLVTGTAADVALAASGGQPTPAPFLWAGFGALGGVAIGGYWTRRVRQRLTQAEAERQAAWARAELAGRHSVAVGADTVVDVLTRTWPLLAVPGKPVGAPLAAWRQHLAEQTAGHADYLATTLLRWEQRHNLAGPDLSRDVEFRTSPVDGTLLLSPGQVAALESELVRLALKDLIEVRVLRARPLGQRQDLMIGPHAITLPEQRQAATPPFDPSALAIALGGIGSLTHSWPTFDGVPLPVSAGLTLTALLTAWWAHRQVAEHGRVARPRVLAAALAVGALDGLLSTLFMRTFSAGGLSRLPFLHAPMFTWTLTLLYVRDLSARQRAAAVAGLAGTLALGAALLPPSVYLHLVDVTTLVWPLAFALGAPALRDLLDRDTSDFDSSLAAAHDAAVAQGYAAGREDVLKLVAEATEEAEQRLTEDRPLLDPMFLPEIERRLTEVRARLAALAAVTPCTPA